MARGPQVPHPWSRQKTRYLADRQKIYADRRLGITGLHYNICNRRDVFSKRRDVLHSHEQNHGNAVSAKFVFSCCRSGAKSKSKLSELKLSTRVKSRFFNFKINLYSLKI